MISSERDAAASEGATAVSCADLAQQLHAVESAVAGAKRELIHDHVEHCLDDTAEAGNVRAALREFRVLAKYL